MRIKLFLSKLKNKILFSLLKFRRRKITVLDSLETVKFILKERCSVSRFGDGEFGMIKLFIDSKSNFRPPHFQKYDPELGKKLYEILNNPDLSKVNLYIGLPKSLFKNVSDHNNNAQYFWQSFSNKNLRWLIPLLSKNQIYLDSQFSRFYIDYKDRKWSSQYVLILKQIWENRDLLIVEGTQTRLGVGNNLFESAKSIRRILAPPVNAFDRYDDIFELVKIHSSKEDLIILALGCTATVLAYDLALLGYQAIDIGHVDIEYEWMLKGATHKIAIEGKYTNEADGGRNPEECTDKIYISQIIAQL